MQEDGQEEGGSYDVWIDLLGCCIYSQSHCALKWVK